MEKNLFLPADVLLPKKDFKEWSVIACDQYTSEPEYWSETEKAVGDKPSALRIILPEVYLSEDDSEKIKAINSTMDSYLENGVFDCYENTMIYTRRTLKNGAVRHGLVGLIDLEDYSYKVGADTLIRATEQTVVERIPPRVAIRRDASIEIPHVMLLINDEDRTVIEPIAENTDGLIKLYDFDLIQNSGHLTGYALRDTEVKAVNNSLKAILDKNEDGLLFAVGDGNHSLATAKECYNQGCGSRYALVEVVNIHDLSLEFEPIYRVVFGADFSLVDDFLKESGGEYYGEDAQKFTCVYGNEIKEISVKPDGTLPIATLQGFLDKYLKDKAFKIDYVHGIENTKKLCEMQAAVGFLFEGMGKSELFTAVAKDGSLPRKTFSMGCADDKRFYLESRIIKN